MRVRRWMRFSVVTVLLVGAALVGPAGPPGPATAAMPPGSATAAMPDQPDHGAPATADGARSAVPSTADGARSAVPSTADGARSAAAAVNLPTGFQEQVVFTGLNQPTNIEFAPDGRVFVAEKGGRIKVFDDLADATPTVFADLSANVHNQWDRGLLGLALAPGFPADPWVYVLYTYDAPPGQTAPVWNDVCGNANDGRCVVTGRLSRLRASGNVMTGGESVLVADWCQQYPSHSIGDLAFGADGMLYVSSGDGASFSATDYGQLGNPVNPCGDPPGGAMTPPTAEGGALRSQDYRTTADPTGLDGTVLRLDPATGAAAPGNPLAGSADPNARRIVGAGLRNPFRMTIRPGTNEVWLGDVGWNIWEEVNRLPDPTAGVTNFGWPCYEGNGRMSSYDNANLNLCESLYAGAGQTAPHFAYHHSADVVPGENCGTGGDAVGGLAFYPGSGGSYPASYAGALFFADYSRGCVWAMRATTPGGLPSPSSIELFAQAAARPADLAVGPGGELYYVDLGGTVRRVRYFPGNQPPTATIEASPTSGPAPLTVAFDGRASSDPDPADAGRLSFAWDFTSDGTVDATTPTASFTYPVAGSVTARLTVTDTLGATHTATVVVQPGNSAPSAVIDTPAVGTDWRVGDTLTFSGHATDPQQGTLPASALRWRLRLEHCEAVDQCHTHPLREWTGVASGEFVAPDHDYPSHLELELTATDAAGLTHTVVRRLDPRTVELTFASDPPGLRLTAGAFTGTAPFTRTVIAGATTTVSAPSPQSTGSLVHTFASWSDGGAASHVLTAPEIATSYVATYDSAPGCVDSAGYTCVTTTDRPFLPAPTVLPASGDDVLTEVDLPFGFPLYGQTHQRAWVSSNGFLTFAAPGSAAATNTALPDPAAPNAALYPFWDDLVLRSDSTLRTGVTGSAPDRRFVVEWRTIGLYGSSSARITVQAVLAENGEITFGYADLSSAGRERGDSATVGIENGTGTVALTHSVNQPVLRDGTSVVFSPPGGPPPSTGSVSGVVTNAVTGAPVAGATVALAPGGRDTTTAADGSYELRDVPAGAYTVTASAAGGLTGSTAVTVLPGGAHTADLSLTAPVGGGGSYTVSTQARPYQGADGGQVLPLAGDDAVLAVDLPVAVEFYGATYPSAWLSTNGYLAFVDPGTINPSNVALPDAGLPNAAVYPFWDDLVVRPDTVVRTAVLGAGADRRVVVEWRDIGQYGSSSARITFSVVFHADGEIAFHYAGLAATKPRERGDSATVGVENIAGTAATQHSHLQPVLADGTAVVFRPAG